jgi:hypothetical protein
MRNGVFTFDTQEQYVQIFERYLATIWRRFGGHLAATYYRIAKKHAEPKTFCSIIEKLAAD